MSCKCASFDSDSCRWECSVSGDGCIFVIPNSKACAEMYGEGPDVYEESKTEELRDYEREKSDCKDTDCFDNVNGQCTRISDDGRYGICWMEPSEGEY